MKNKSAVINIYNFIRMSHQEPSCFLQDDFDTLAREILAVKRFGFPGTYALKYDALMEPRYQALLLENLDETDEISAWWEITEPLCRRAGVPFRGRSRGKDYDQRVDSAYAIGYTPEERRRLVDAYMEDFHQVFGRYPETIGSWVLDAVTLDYASGRYGVAGAAICRDQLNTDGFTLWGGWPNGAYYPSRKNAFMPAVTPENQISMPVFRLLGPDPIRNFEAGARRDLQGVYTLEPSWVMGRSSQFITWLLTRLTDEDTLGMGYAQIGQENNFLWENIQPGLMKQLELLRDLTRSRHLRVETMGTTARWFRSTYAMTPPATFQASLDYDRQGLSVLWYASPWYRVGFLGEQGHLRIRDLFLYDENYPSRYLEAPMTRRQSTFDALPVLSPQLWGMSPEQRPFLRLVDGTGREPAGTIWYGAVNSAGARAVLTGPGGYLAEFLAEQQRLVLRSSFRLRFDYLPSFRIRGQTLNLEHNGFPYGLTVARGEIRPLSDHSLELLPAQGRVELLLGEGCVSPPEEPPVPVQGPVRRRPVPPEPPRGEPEDSVFPWGTSQKIRLVSEDGGQIRFTADGTEPTEESPLYRGPLTVTRDIVLRARLFLPDGRSSETRELHYRFSLKNMTLTSPTCLDLRPVFRGNGLEDLLQQCRGNLDFICGRWRGTLEDLDVTARLEAPVPVRSVAMGFLSSHRSGIVFPASVELYAGADPDSMTLRLRETLPCRPGPREICKMDVELPLEETVGAIRVVARRYERMPDWCCYHGDRNVFTLADCLIVTPMAQPPLP